MRSEEEIKNCTTNGVPNENIIRSLQKELEIYKKALMLACEYFEMEDAGLFYERFMQEARNENNQN